MATVSKNAVQYAEEDLDVHGVFLLAIKVQEELGGYHADLTLAHSQRVSIEDKIERREADLRSDERGKLSDLSATAFDLHYKMMRSRDAQLGELRKGLNEIRYQINTLEAQVRTAESRIKIYTSRMTELGGYLNYLAAAKQAQGVSR